MTALHHLTLGLFLSLTYVTNAARAADEPLLEHTRKLASESFDDKKAAIDALAGSADMRAVDILDGFSKSNLYQYKDSFYVGQNLKSNDKGDKVTTLKDPFKSAMLMENGREAEILVSELKEVSVGRRERVLVRDALVLLRMTDPNDDKRFAAVVRAGDSGGDSNLVVLKKLETLEKNPRVKGAILESILIIEAASTDAAVQKRAIEELGVRTSSRALPRLKEMAAVNKDPEKTKLLSESMAKIESWQSTSRGIGYTFSGLSMGSILVLMALGLSIIFGLMGVINMAHGELMMIGAYSTYLTQQAFVKYASPASFDYYFLVAIPISFFAAAFVGYLIEVLIVKHLYGRPLETLLATWGVSYILIQAVRVTFGDNIAVNSPSWLQGGAEVMADVVLPYNRLFIIVFCLSTVLLMYWIIERTKLGLLLRATTQNRNMAGALGVNTRHIDGYTFGLGAGLAGMAGCALTQVGGVTPDMGQNYVIDSFLVVVTGGVGKLAGAIWAGLGMGFLNKYMEPFAGAVWAKVLILVAVVLFIQWRPSGLFPAKGRLADA